MNQRLNDIATLNFIRIKERHLVLPILFLFSIALFVFQKGENFSTLGYIDINADSFFYLNKSLSKMPNLQYNLTQFGDALISYSFLTIFILYVPKIWEVLLTSSVISLLVSTLLKELFAVPRPAAIFDNTSFTIIGEILRGSTSLPSGHSMTIFIVISTVFFALCPRNNCAKVFFAVLCLTAGLFIAFTRIGVGAHYPLDAIIGSIIGYLITILGILINNKLNLWDWIQKRKFLPFFMLVFVITISLIVRKIWETNLLICYFSLFSVFTTLYLTIQKYVQKQN